VCITAQINHKFNTVNFISTGYSMLEIKTATSVGDAYDLIEGYEEDK